MIWDFEYLAGRVAKLEAEYDATAKEVGAAGMACERAGEDHRQAAEIQELVQEVAAEIQTRTHSRIAAVVSRCLESVFDDPYTFGIQFDRKRGRTEAVLYFERDGRRITDPASVGGGVLDVASFALRLSCLMLTRPALRKVLVLDEPMKGLNGHTERERFRSLLETLPAEMGVQIILATGLEWLQCGRIVEMRK